MTAFDSDKDFFEIRIEQVVTTWMEDLIWFLERIYEGKWLPSHDISHHHRVWLNAVKLSRLILPNYPSVRPSFLSELIISCFFHDTGLLINPGEFHGAESKKFTVRFLESCQHKVDFNTSQLLDAIERHDDKNYLKENNNADLLLEILSLADDIDAFGAVGLYRYIEIYLMRDMVPAVIPELILSNVEKRYTNLEACLKRYNASSVPYNQLYNDLKYFLNDKTFTEDAVTLVNWIKEEIVDKKLFPENIIRGCATSSICNQRIRSFIVKYREDNLKKG